jgi:FAD/FMN-containing dehydrogenase
VENSFMTISRRSMLGAGAGTLTLAMLGQSAVQAEVRSDGWASLAARLHGDLILPSDATYLTAKQVAYLNFTTSPRAIAYCQDAADVSVCLKFAQDNNIRFAVRSGGHSFAGYSLSTGLVIDVSRLNSVTVGANSTTIGTGAQLVDITSTLAASGLTFPGGAHPTTGAGGFLQGGGIGLLTRSAGIASDRVTAAKVVLASGRLVTASATENPDLFWAIRGGGGGNFGVVTEFTATPLPIPLINAASMVWSYDSAVDALDGYARWLVDAPNTIGGAIRVVLADSAPGQVPHVAATLASVGSMDELTAEVAHLTAAIGTPPVFSQIDTLPYSILLMAVYGCAPYTVPQCHLIGYNADGQLPRIGFGTERSRLFSTAPARSVWENAVSVFDTQRVAGHGHNLEILAMGGVANEPSRSATAYVHRNALFTADFLVQAAAPATASEAAAGQAWVNAGFLVIDPASTGETYQNFVDPSLRDWKSSYYAENYAKLVRVKHTYDPYGAFCFAQSIG